MFSIEIEIWTGGERKGSSYKGRIWATGSGMEEGLGCIQELAQGNRTKSGSLHECTSKGGIQNSVTDCLSKSNRGIHTSLQTLSQHTHTHHSHIHLSSVVLTTCQQHTRWYCTRIHVRALLEFVTNEHPQHSWTSRGLRTPAFSALLRLFATVTVCAA